MRYSLIGLLLINALTAIGGGLALLLGLIDMPRWYLQYTPFGSFIWPGLILIFIVGGSALAALISFVRNYHYAPLISLLSGIIMEIWILAEMLLVLQLSWIQVFYLCTGTVIVIFSTECMLKQLEKQFQKPESPKNHVTKS